MTAMTPPPDAGKRGIQPATTLGAVPPRATGDAGRYEVSAMVDGPKVVSLLPMKYEQTGWSALCLLAVSAEDGATRIEAAERLIRLGREFAPDLSGMPPGTLIEISRRLGLEQPEDET